MRALLLASVLVLALSWTAQAAIEIEADEGSAAPPLLREEQMHLHAVFSTFARCMENAVQSDPRHDAVEANSLIARALITCAPQGVVLVRVYNMIFDYGGEEYLMGPCLDEVSRGILSRP